MTLYGFGRALRHEIRHLSRNWREEERERKRGREEEVWACLRAYAKDGDETTGENGFEVKTEGKVDVKRDEFVRKARWREHCSNCHEWI